MELGGAIFLLVSVLAFGIPLVWLVHNLSK